MRSPIPSSSISARLRSSSRPHSGSTSTRLGGTQPDELGKRLSRMSLPLISQLWLAGEKRTTSDERRPTRSRNSEGPGVYFVSSTGWGTKT